MDKKQKTVADIVAEMRGFKRYAASDSRDCRYVAYWLYQTFADRIEAAQKRERDSIHRAMVLIAGIEMEDSEAPPRLWTALEDAYDALSDALGTDGDATADMAEAEATGRHFVVKSSRNGAKMREALEYVLHFDATDEAATEDGLTDAERIAEYADHITECQKKANAALSAPPRNCDVGTAEEQFRRYHKFCMDGHGCSRCRVGIFAGAGCSLAWAQMPYKDGGEK